MRQTTRKQRREAKGATDTLAPLAATYLPRLPRATPLSSSTRQHSTLTHPALAFARPATTPDDPQRLARVRPQTSTHLFGPTPLFTSRENPARFKHPLEPTEPLR